MFIMPEENISTVRNLFVELLRTKNFTENKNKTGSKTIELINASFIADEDTIFGDLNEEYVERESQWYHSQSLNVNDIPGGAPKIWQMVSTPEKGEINSNYGWCIFSDANFNQFDKCAEQLEADDQSRRAIMIYTRPSIQNEYNRDGMSDFICTNTVQYFIRDVQLIACVHMRSNDGWAGFRNDLAWQQEVQHMLHERLVQTYPTLEIGPIVWNAGSIHIYERQFYLVDNYEKTGNTHISKDDYKAAYPDSPYA